MANSRKKTTKKKSKPRKKPLFSLRQKQMTTILKFENEMTKDKIKHYFSVFGKNIQEKTFRKSMDGLLARKIVQEGLDENDNRIYFLTGKGKRYSDQGKFLIGKRSTKKKTTRPKIDGVTLTDTMRVILTFLGKKKALGQGTMYTAEKMRKKALNYRSLKTVENNMDKLEKLGIFTSLPQDLGDGKPYKWYILTDKGASLGKDEKYMTTMRKKVKKNLVDGMLVMSKSYNEKTFGLDFERTKENPERLLMIQQGKNSGTALKDFEFYGHSHPRGTNAIPSHADIISMNEKGQTFILKAKGKKKGDKNEAYILKVKNPKKWREFAFGVKENHKWYNDSVRGKSLKLKKNRDFILKSVGVEIKPYKKDMMVEVPFHKVKSKSEFPEAFHEWLDSDNNGRGNVRVIKNKKKKKSSKKKKATKKKTAKKKKSAKKRKK